MFTLYVRMVGVFNGMVLVAIHDGKVGVFFGACTLCMMIPERQTCRQIYKALFLMNDCCCNLYVMLLGVSMDNSRTASRFVLARYPYCCVCVLHDEPVLGGSGGSYLYAMKGTYAAKQVQAESLLPSGESPEPASSSSDVPPAELFIPAVDVLTLAPSKPFEIH